jgi:hypothetical protein
MDGSKQSARRLARAVLTHKLIESLEEEESPDAASQWIEVAKRRAKELDDGTESGIPAEEVFRQLEEEPARAAGFESAISTESATTCSISLLKVEWLYLNLVKRLYLIGTTWLTGDSRVAFIRSAASPRLVQLCPV